MKKKVLPKFHVISWDINRKKVEYYDIFPYIIDCYKNVKNKEHFDTFDQCKAFIIKECRYRFWARCEYEIIVDGFPPFGKPQKIDIFDQVESNIDVITDLFINYLKQ